MCAPTPPHVEVLPMQKRIRVFARVALWIGSSLAVSGPFAAGADIFAYRTDDGVFAYTDDRDKIPARYADDAVAVRDAHLHAYPRLTVEDTRAVREVSARMEKRLDYLRQLNAPTPRAREAATVAARRAVISVATGSAQAPTFE